jgi:site-specific recombinase XerD
VTAGPSTAVACTASDETSARTTFPAKRFKRSLIAFLIRAEVDALLATPDRCRCSGRRDHALILLAVQTGRRLSEFTGLRHDDESLGTGSHVRVVGKGRKERCTPLSRTTRVVLAAWMGEPLKAQGQPLFPNARGGQLSAHGLYYLLAKHAAAAGAPITDRCLSVQRICFPSKSGQLTIR